MDIIYEILLHVDGETLKNFNMTHKHIYPKHFWVNKFKQDNIPVFKDYSLDEYCKILHAKQTYDYITQLMMHEKRNEMIVDLSILPTYLWTMYEIHRSCFSISNNNLMFNYGTSCIPISDDEKTNIMLRTLYEDDQVVIEDSNFDPYYPLTHIQHRIDNKYFAGEKLRKRKDYWEKLNII